MTETGGRRSVPTALLRLVAPAILVLGLAGATFAVNAWDQESRARADEVRLLARGGAAEIDRFLRSQLASVVAIAAADPVVDGRPAEMSAYFDRIDPPSIGFDGQIFWVGNDGVMRARSRYDGAPIDFSDREWVQEVLRTGQPYVSNARVGQLNNAPIVVFAVPTHDASGERTGVLGAAMRLDEARVSAFSLERAAGTEVSIVDRIGQVVAAREPVTDLRSVVPGFDFEGLRDGGEGTLREAMGPTGEQGRLVGYAAVPTGDWLLLVDQPEAAISGPAQQRLVGQLGLIVAITALAAGAAVWSSRRVEQALVRQEQALAAELEAKERLEALVNELQEREEQREAFVGVLSHELRTPTTTIYGMAAVLARSPGRADRDEIVDDIRDEADRLNRIIEDLLVLSRAERKVLTVKAEPVLVQRLVPTVVTDLGRRHPGVDLRVEVPASLAPVRAESGALRQVLFNLLSNAAKYGAGSPVRLVGDELDGAVRLVVSDGGPGFPPEDAERLFDLYYRSPGTARQASGTGIGLFVVRQLVEAMGGRVEASSTVSSGATFTVTLRSYASHADDDGASQAVGQPAPETTPGA